MSLPKIEKGIPIPMRASMSALAGQLDVGDSFLIPDWIKAPQALAVNVGTANKGKKFTVRRTDDGWRLWRAS